MQITTSFFHGLKGRSTYGELLQKAKNAVRFLYNGSYGVVTDENGLYYMRARYYNPDIKRFLNQDIKVGDISNGQGLNRYAYCEGNPVSMVDPFGLSPQISQDQTSRFSVLHNILDLAGLAFDAADVINAAFYAAEGDWTNAALCAVAVIPIAGSAIAGAAKGTKAVIKAKKAEKILELAEESCKMTRNASDRLDVFSDVMKASSKWGNSPVKLMDGITAETGSRAIKALETGGDFGRESKRAVQELKAVVGAEGIHLKPSVSRKVDVFKDSFVKTEKAVKGGSSSGTWDMPEGGGVINGIEYSQHAMERMAPNTPQVRAELSRRAEKTAEQLGYKPGTQEYYEFCKKYVDPRNIPPSVIEDAIASTKSVAGKTVGTFVHETADVKVIVNANGKVVTVIPK